MLRNLIFHPDNLLYIANEELEITVDKSFVEDGKSKIVIKDVLDFMFRILGELVVFSLEQLEEKMTLDFLMLMLWPEWMQKSLRILMMVVEFRVSALAKKGEVSNKEEVG